MTTLTLMIQVEVPAGLKTGPGRYDHTVDAHRVKDAVIRGVCVATAIHTWLSQCAWHVSVLELDAEKP